MLMLLGQILPSLVVHHHMHEEPPYLGTLQIRKWIPPSVPLDKQPQRNNLHQPNRVSTTPHKDIVTRKLGVVAEWSNAID